MTDMPLTCRTAHRLLRCASVFALLVLATAVPGALLSQEQPQGQPITGDYRIGTKDLMEIRVFELPELTQTVRVAEDGSITLSLLGRIEVSGLTTQELESKLAKILEEKFLKTAHVNVFIREYQRVSVLGAVGRPGMYEIVGPTTLLQIISQAGGLTAEAMNDLYIFRTDKDGKQTRIVVNLKDLISNGNQELNYELRPKDVISIPIDQVQTVFVYGEVRNPGVIQFRQSKKITLLQAIAQAGGPTEWASKSGVMIKRRDKKTGKEIKIPVNLKSIESGKTADLTLEEGDVVIVP